MDSQSRSTVALRGSLNARIIVSFAFLLFFYLPLPMSNAYAQIRVDVSRQWSVLEWQVNEIIAPGQEKHVAIKRGTNTRFFVKYNIAVGEFFAILADARDMASKDPKYEPLATRTLARNEVWALPAIPEPTGAVLIVVNNSPFPARLSLVLVQSGTASEKATTDMREMLEFPIRDFTRQYNVPPLTVTVKPCGTINAFSDPQITICSELVADLVDRNLANALSPILFHELAHSLLYMWNVPGYDNEQLADEFAVFFVGPRCQSCLASLGRWFQSADPMAEAINILMNGSRHPLSSQRAQNIFGASTNLVSIERRWNAKLESFKRR